MNEEALARRVPCPQGSPFNSVSGLPLGLPARRACLPTATLPAGLASSFRFRCLHSDHPVNPVHPVQTLASA
jgi:hypothetical protein